LRLSAAICQASRVAASLAPHFAKLVPSGALAGFGFGFGGGVRYVGSSFADTANTMLVPSRVLGDAAIHYEWQNWRFAVNVANIADKIYVASCSTANACFYGDRRRITGSIGYKW
jgi:iron complex outermembrane receptor protein